MNPERPPFRKFWDLGYKRLVPIVPPDAEVSEKSSLFKRPGARGKAVGFRGDDGLWRGFDWLKHDTTEADLERWGSMGAGVGIRTGGGLVAVDIDSLDPDIVTEAAELSGGMLGGTCQRIGRSPKSLLLFATLEPIPYQRVEFTGHKGQIERIELLADGRQFVAHGIHPFTGKPYEWIDPICPIEDLVAVSQADIDAYFAELAKRLPAAVRPVSPTASPDRAKIDQAGLIGDAEHVKCAVVALPNTAELFPTYDDYIRVGAAIKGATQDDPELGRDLFLSWAERWEGGDNDPDVVLADYSRIKPPYELGARWLYQTAGRYNPAAFSHADLWFQPIEEAESLFPQNSGYIEQKARKLEFTHILQAAESARTYSTKPLIKGLLDQGAMTVLYGESNTGKTFVAIDIAFHIAAGLPWGGMKTTQMPVVYVAAEGGAGARKRAAALHMKYGDIAAKAPFHFLLSPIDLLNENADLEPLVAAVAGLGEPVGLIVIDTLSRAMAGGDENASTDMGALVKHFDRLRAATGAHLLAVHHSGKDKARGARGHSLLRAATDTEIEIADGQIAVTKQRDLDSSFASKFERVDVVLWEDEDGLPVTSCTVRLCGRDEVKIGLPTPKEQDVLDGLADMLKTTPGSESGVLIDDITAYFGDKMSRNAVKVHLSSLKRKGQVVQQTPRKWRLNCVLTGGFSGVFE